MALTAIRASKPFSLVHTHHFVSALDADRPWQRKLPIRIAPSFVQGCNRPVVVLAASHHRHEDDARDLVGERHRGQIELVFDRLAFEHAARPGRKASLLASAMARRSRMRPPPEGLAQVAVAHLCDAPEPRFAAGRVLARCQAEEGSELTPAREDVGVLDRGHDRRCGDRANAGNGHQPLGRLVRLDRRRKLPVDHSDRLVERVYVTDKRTKRAAHAIGDDDLAILVETVGSHALQAMGMVRALRRDEADLGQMARAKH